MASARQLPGLSTRINWRCAPVRPISVSGWSARSAAHDFGYLTVDQVVDKLTRTMETIDKLERYEGHLLNWYDIQTLAPLEPRYVSTVDSGNLLGALWTLEHGLDELIRGPVLDAKAFEGLRDTGEILKQTAERGRRFRSRIPRLFDELMRAWEDPPDRIVDALRLLRRMERSARALAGAARGSADSEAGAAYWADQMERQVSSWLRYRGSLSRLDRNPRRKDGRGDRTAGSGGSARHAARICIMRLRFSISPRDTSAAFRSSSRSGRRRPRPTGLSSNGSTASWKPSRRSKWLAGEMLALSERLIQDGRELSESINMRFLYDSEPQAVLHRLQRLRRTLG